MAKHFRLVHHFLRGAVDRDAVDSYNFISREDPAASESSADTRPTFRLHLLDSDFLVSETRLEPLTHVQTNRASFVPASTAANLNEISAT